MSTTDVIIEHLISGIQAAIWLLLLTVLLFGDSWVSWATIKDIPTELIIAFIAIVYPIGIFIDEIADRLLNPFVEIIRTHIFNKDGKNFYSLEKLWGDAPMMCFENEDL